MHTNHGSCIRKHVICRYGRNSSRLDGEHRSLSVTIQVTMYAETEEAQSWYKVSSAYSGFAFKNRNSPISCCNVQQFLSNRLIASTRCEFRRKLSQGHRYSAVKDVTPKHRMLPEMSSRSEHDDHRSPHQWHLHDGVQRKLAGLTTPMTPHLVVRSGRRQAHSEPGVGEKVQSDQPLAPEPSIVMVRVDRGAPCRLVVKITELHGMEVLQIARLLQSSH